MRSAKQQSHTNYGSTSYWQNRYQKTRGSRFDWLQTFSTCFNIIQESLLYNKQARILNIGCGNGKIQDQLYQAGYQNIVNNDISTICIQEMEKIRFQNQYHNMVYQVMDVQKMTYQSQSFHMVLDKSTIDALMCSDQPIISVALMIEEVYRVLKPNGIYLIISYASPNSRLQNLKRANVNFTITMSEMKKQSAQGGIITHYLYHCKKQQMKALSMIERQAFYEQMKLLQDKQYPAIKK